MPTSSRMGKHLCPEGGVARTFLFEGSRPHFAEVATHDIRAVPRAFQPALHDTLDLCLTGGNVLSNSLPYIAGVAYPSGDALIVGVAVTKEFLFSHVP